MQDSRCIIGVGVSKSKPDYCASDSLRGTLANTPEGMSRLLDTIIAAHPGVPHVCLGHTGIYGRLLREGCRGRGMDYSLLDPKKTCHYKKGKYGTRAKTDRHDARLIRNYAADNPPRPSTPPTQRQEGLRELGNLRAKLAGQCSEPKTGLRHARVKSVIAHHESHIARLGKEIAGLDGLVTALMHGDETAATLRRRFMEAPGIGNAAATAVLLHLGDAIGDVSAKRIASLAGLAPIPDDSGDLSLPWRIEGGRKRVRGALYMASLSASRYNPVLKAFYRRLKEERKPSRRALVAVARKLLCLMNRIAGDPDFKPVATGQVAPPPSSPTPLSSSPWRCTTE